MAAPSLLRSIRTVQRSAYAAESASLLKVGHAHRTGFATPLVKELKRWLFAIKRSILTALRAWRRWLRANVRPILTSTRDGVYFIFGQHRAEPAFKKCHEIVVKFLAASYGRVVCIRRATGRPIATIKPAILAAAKNVLFATARLRPVQWLMRQSDAMISRLLTDKRGPILLSFSARIIGRRIPVVSGLALRMTHYAIVTMLISQMTTAHTGNTLVLARLTNLLFRSYIRNREMPISFLYFQALFRFQQYRRITKEFGTEEKLDTHYFNHILGVALLYSNQPTLAKFYLKRAITFHTGYFADYRSLGKAELLLGNKAAAGQWLEKSVELAPNTVMAHQNYAGRYDIRNYKPRAWELQHARSLMPYDNYGQLAEDFFLLGKYHESLALYQKMLDHQKEMNSSLPQELIVKLARTNSRFDPNKAVRMLPYEWVTQFGHIGLLDSYVKMARTGMYPDANYVLLAPKEMIANDEYLSYWDQMFTIVRDKELIDELFPYQRFVGDNFMAHPGKQCAEFWTRAAARAHIEWAKQGHPPLISVSTKHREAGAKTLTALGIPTNAWYVSLHVREGGYHGETAGSIGSHRNASIDDYIPAIKLITERGGYVIRLGDRSMRPAPKIDGLIDYALSPEKSPAIDIFFCGTSRFVIGTTSGLTTACVSFGTPLVLVNCISNDWQLWSDNTHFIVKPVRDIRNKRFVPFAEVFVPPIQGYLINSQVMRRKGLEPIPNTPEEITEAVRYKLDIVDSLTTPPKDWEEPMRSYIAAMADNPLMFGAARPVPKFLEMRPELLKRTSENSTPA